MVCVMPLGLGPFSVVANVKGQANADLVCGVVPLPPWGEFPRCSEAFTFLLLGMAVFGIGANVKARLTPSSSLK